MSALYTGFKGVRPVIFMAAVALICLLAGPVSAQNYTVEGVEVDVTAANAVKAREEALIEAQVKAFEQLALQTLGEEGMATYTMPDADTIMALVKDFEVTNEQLSAKHYKGMFTVRFRPALAQQYLTPQTAAYDTAQPDDMYQQTQQHQQVPIEQRPYQNAPQPAYQPPVYQQPAPVYQPAPVVQGRPAMIRARFAGVQEWVRLKQALERNRAFSLRRIASLKPTEALVELSFNGTPADLQQALIGAGLSVSPAQSVALDTAAPLFDVGFGGYSRY